MLAAAMFLETNPPGIHWLELELAAESCRVCRAAVDALLPTEKQACVCLVAADDTAVCVPRIAKRGVRAAKELSAGVTRNGVAAGIACSLGPDELVLGVANVLCL